MLWSREQIQVKRCGFELLEALVDSFGRESMLMSTWQRFLSELHLYSLPPHIVMLLLPLWWYALRLLEVQVAALGFKFPREWGGARWWCTLLSCYFYA